MSAKKPKNSINIAQLVWEMTEPIVTNYGLELVDVEYVKEGGQWIVRVFIDREKTPIDHEACQLVSESVSQLLDEKDPIPTSYILEVSSPGIERPLKKAADYVRFAGETVLVSLYQPLDGKKEYQGRLIGLIDDTVKIEVKQKELSIPLAKIAKTSLAAKF
ncbi:MAG: ribosome maturation factor RimP [Bacillota bacterium]|jgi:ribosome maturation factor RimP